MAFRAKKKNAELLRCNPLPSLSLSLSLFAFYVGGGENHKIQKEKLLKFWKKKGWGGGGGEN